MGVNNRQRRAAKRRKRAEGRRGHPGGVGAPPGWFSDWPSGSSTHRRDDHVLATALLVQAVAATEADRAAARTHAELLAGPGSPVSPLAVAGAVEALLEDQVHAVTHEGWTPSDLAEVLRRRLSARHLPPLAALLAAQADRHPGERVATAWRDELNGLGPAQRADATTPDGLELALGLCALLGGLPPITTLIPPPGSPVVAASATTAASSRVLSRVRALLAKAESTEFPEEAEALSAKAQELISRQALDRLLTEAEHHRGGEPVTARRLWIEPPYVLAKGVLVAAVAEANRCQSVLSEQLGFSAVVGEAGDLDAVELLVTSLLVQANAAMLACGRRAGAGGMSRTTSFRRSFLVAYATRIGERLRSATHDATEQTGRAGELVPVLRRQAEQVEAARDALFPDLVMRRTTATNGHGWAAGRAAADLALLDANLEITEAAS